MNELVIVIRGARPNTLYTTWVDFKSRATDQLSPDYPVDSNPVDLSKSGPGIERGVAPAFATTDPVYEGMRVDLNGIITDQFGNGVARIALDYNLLGTSSSPVTAATLSLQGMNRLGGSWLRIFTEDIASGASAQQLDSQGRPALVRATAQGLTIVGHNSPISHGHTPGVAGVDHFPGFFGDFPSRCV